MGRGVVVDRHRVEIAGAAEIRRGVKNAAAAGRRERVEVDGGAFGSRDALDTLCPLRYKRAFWRKLVGVEPNPVAFPRGLRPLSY